MDEDDDDDDDDGVDEDGDDGDECLCACCCCFYHFIVRGTCLDRVTVYHRLTLCSNHYHGFKGSAKQSATILVASPGNITCATATIHFPF